MNDRVQRSEGPSQFILIWNGISFNYGAKLTRNMSLVRNTTRDKRDEDNSGITEASRDVASEGFRECKY